MKKIIISAIFLTSSSLFAQSISYKLPFPKDDSYTVTQCGDEYTGSSSFSHTGKMAYAWDFSTGIGDDIVAAADGKVAYVEEGYDQGRCDPSLVNRANRVVIKHADGYSSLYLHLLKNSVNVNPGDTVRQGQVIGKGGASGYVCSSYGGSGAHLHFQLQESCGSWWCQSKRISFDEQNQCKKGKVVTSENYENTSSSFVNRSNTLKLILDKFQISTLNAGFNNSIFGESITIPYDVNSSTTNYDYIVTAYNKGIVQGSNGQFRPASDISLAEFIIMVVRAIPIPLDNPNYTYYSHDSSEWYYSYINAAFNAGLIDSKYYSFTDGVSSTVADDILSKAYEYYLGNRSGISIYAKWYEEHADIDLYLYSLYDGNSVSIQHDNKYRVTNMSDLRNSGGIVYWYKHSSNWGANLDYDSWGANGNQPWAGVGEERVTVDSQRVRRPGKYSIILCYYNWNVSENPTEASVEWWGINTGKNINVGGNNFFTSIEKDTCKYSGTLNTN